LLALWRHHAAGGATRGHINLGHGNRYALRIGHRDAGVLFPQQLRMDQPVAVTLPLDGKGFALKPRGIEKPRLLPDPHVVADGERVAQQRILHQPLFALPEWSSRGFPDRQKRFEPTLGSSAAPRTRKLVTALLIVRGDRRIRSAATSWRRNMSDRIVEIRGALAP